MHFKFEFELNRVIDMNSFSSGHTCIYFSFSYFPLALVHCLQIYMSYSHRLLYALLTDYLYTISINSLHFILSHSAYSIDSSIHLFFILRPLLSLCVSLSVSLLLSLFLTLTLTLSLSHSLSLSFLLSLSLSISIFFQWTGKCVGFGNMFYFKVFVISLSWLIIFDLVLIILACAKVT